MLGDQLKKAVEQSGKDRNEIALHMGVSLGNLYKLFKKETFEWEYIRKASEITGYPVAFFIDSDAQIVDYNQKSADKGAFGIQVTDQLADGIEELKRMFEEELRAKNQQIDNLQEILKMVLGKSSGALRSRIVNRLKSQGGNTIFPLFDPKTVAVAKAV